MMEEDVECGSDMEEDVEWRRFPHPSHPLDVEE